MHLNTYLVRKLCLHGIHDFTSVDVIQDSTAFHHLNILQVYLGDWSRRSTQPPTLVRGCRRARNGFLPFRSHSVDGKGRCNHKVQGSWFPIDLQLYVVNACAKSAHWHTNGAQWCSTKGKYCLNCLGGSWAGSVSCLGWRRAGSISWCRCRLRHCFYNRLAHPIASNALVKDPSSITYLDICELVSRLALLHFNHFEFLARFNSLSSWRGFDVRLFTHSYSS
mmetsp:Transcript_26014/g.60123  ORF Transcript_26014/g.60123 Transcript_26014/m.60123 type:complete len:222 (+) Transcript_26014:790-1455(+)